MNDSALKTLEKKKKRIVWRR